MSAKIRFSKSAILFRIKCGPVKLLELAQGSKNYSVRKRLMRHINALEADGAIKKLWMQGFPHYVTADYESTDDDQVRALLGNCRPVDGCMVWAGHVDPQRGPIGRLEGGKPVSVRRYIWGVKRLTLGLNEVIRMREECEHGCCEYAHMHVAPRNADAKGRPVMPAHRHAMTVAVRARLGKLDWDKVRAIRASDEPNKVLAERYDVSSSLIGQVKRHEVWVEHDTYCAGLFKEAA